MLKLIESLRTINWNDARPWVAMLGALILFLGWDLKKKRRELRKLDLEIQELRKSQSVVRVATIQEMNSLIQELEKVFPSKRDIIGTGRSTPLEHFAVRLRDFLVLASSSAQQPNPLSLYHEWQEIKSLAVNKLSGKTISDIEFVFRLLLLSVRDE